MFLIIFILVFLICLENFKNLQKGIPVSCKNYKYVISVIVYIATVILINSDFYANNMRLTTHPLLC